jgi:hypothetical protein
MFEVKPLQKATTLRGSSAFCGHGDGSRDISAQTGAQLCCSNRDNSRASPSPQKVEEVIVAKSEEIGAGGMALQNAGRLSVAQPVRLSFALSPCRVIQQWVEEQIKLAKTPPVQGLESGRRLSAGHEGQGADSSPSAVFFSGRSSGNRITSRMEDEPVSSMVRRSIPMPSPAVGGMP